MTEEEWRRQKDEGGGPEKPHPQNPSDDAKEFRCKFFLTGQARECKFNHSQRDEKRRCYSCGAVDHISPNCPRAGGREHSAKTKVLREEEEAGGPGSTTSRAAEATEESTVKELLEEANRMLKTLTKEDTTSSPSGEPKQEATLDTLQQINELKQKTMKLSQLTQGTAMGLIDSGATHPLRPARDGELVGEYKEVTVTLASGEKTKLRMSSGGVMVTLEEGIEPIVPMGILVSRLGCKVTWVGEKLQVEHPRRGRLEVDVHLTACPQISRTLALDFIDELEGVKKEKVKTMTMEMKSDLTWMEQLVEAHPVL